MDEILGLLDSGTGDAKESSAAVAARAAGDCTCWVVDVVLLPVE